MRLPPSSVFAAFLVLCLAPVVSLAGDAVRVGYVNVVKVIEEAPQGEAAREKLEAEFRPRDEELVATRKKLRDLEVDLEKNSLVLSDADRREKERELVQLRRNLKQAAQEFREDYNLRRNEELSALQKVVYKVIAEIAKEDGYDLIVHEGAIFASDKIDITGKVLDKLSKLNKK
jgi:outer membrane protein